VIAILPSVTQSATVANETGDTSTSLSPQDIAEAAVFLAARDPKVGSASPRFTIGDLMCAYS